MLLSLSNVCIWYTYLVKYFFLIKSSAEDSKILEPDEFDFMIVLANFRESERCTVYYIGSESVNAFESKNEVGRDGRIASAKILYYLYVFFI